MSLSGNQLTRIGDMGTPGRAYAGFTAKAASSSVYAGGLEYTIPGSRMQYTLPDSKVHYTVPDDE